MSGLTPGRRQAVRAELEIRPPVGLGNEPCWSVQVIMTVDLRTDEISVRQRNATTGRGSGAGRQGSIEQPAHCSRSARHPRPPRSR